MVVVDTEYIKKVFVAGIKNRLTGDSKNRKEGVHTSSIVYECGRLLWFELTEKKEIPERANAENVDLEDMGDGLFRIWMGSEFHKTPLTSKHESELWWKYNGYDIGGTVDEIIEENDGEDRIILDKKFVAVLPDKMYEHHRRQVMFYAVLLREVNKYLANGISLLYVKPILNTYREERYRVFLEKITPGDIDEYKSKLDIILARIKGKEKFSSWFCKYCQFGLECKAMDLEFEKKNDK